MRFVDLFRDSIGLQSLFAKIVLGMRWIELPKKTMTA